MKFKQYYSSSGGNLYTLTADNGKRLLLECGVRWQQLQKALDYDLSNIVGCLLTHSHRDHSKAVREVMKAGIDIFASQETIEAMDTECWRRMNLLKANEYINIWDFHTLPYNAHHDADGTLYFVIGCDDQYMLFAPDTSLIKQRFNIPFSVIAIECSYDYAILQNRIDTNDINEELAERLLTSHMEKQTTMRYLAKFCDLSKCTEIHLLHMSRDNIDAEQTRKEFESRFFIKTIVVNRPTNEDE